MLIFQNINNLIYIKFLLKMSEQEPEIPNQQEQVTTQQKLPSEQPIKKLNSYTYWVDQKNKSKELPPEQRPQKIDPPKLETKPSDGGRSNWNTAGTWENKILSLPNIEKEYTEKLNQWIEKNIPDFKLKKVSLNGQCQIIFIRTKKALTYEINGKVEFQKKPQQQQPKEQQKQKSEQQSTEKKEVKNSSQEGSGDESPQKSPDKSEKKDKPKPKTKKTVTKSKTMTLELVDLTDHGDRDYKCSSSDPDCKKLLSQKSNDLVQILEQILKSYK